MPEVTHENSDAVPPIPAATETPLPLLPIKALHESNKPSTLPTDVTRGDKIGSQGQMQRTAPPQKSREQETELRMKVAVQPSSAFIEENPGQGNERPHSKVVMVDLNGTVRNELTNKNFGKPQEQTRTTKKQQPPKAGEDTGREHAHPRNTRLEGNLAEEASPSGGISEVGEEGIGRRLNKKNISTLQAAALENKNDSTHPVVHHEARMTRSAQLPGTDLESAIPTSQTNETNEKDVFRTHERIQPTADGTLDLNSRNLESDFESPTKVKLSEHNIKAEDVYNFAETIMRQNTCNLFFDQVAIRALMSNILPGTWMSNHKTLASRNFLVPQKSNSYFILCQKSQVLNDRSPTEDSWLLLLLTRISEHCEVLKNESPIQEQHYRSNPGVFLFESEHVGISDDTLLCVRNFLNGVLRKELRKSSKTRTPKKAVLDRLKVLLQNVCGNVVHVRMPQPPSPSLKSAYCLANIQYLSSEGHLTALLSSRRLADTTQSRKRTFGTGKKGIEVNVDVSVIDASKVYTETYVEPLLAFT